MCEQGSLVIGEHKVCITRAEADDGEHGRTIFVEDVPSNLVEFLELVERSLLKMFRQI